WNFGFSVMTFFFFQAEDGIRDATVTGVQTCALPILEATAHLFRLRRLRRCRPSQRTLLTAPPGSLCRGGRRVPQRKSIRHPRYRSEERRVGKEGRTRVVRSQ